MAGACGVIFGRIGELTATRGNAFRGVAQETGAVGVFPGVLGGREVAANVAFGQRAINRVAQRVDADIGVRMPGQALLEGDGDAADDHGTVVRHGVNVKPGTDARNHASS
jgi:hypothetical protein